MITIYCFIENLYAFALANFCNELLLILQTKLYIIKILYVPKEMLKFDFKPLSFIDYPYSTFY